MSGRRWVVVALVVAVLTTSCTTAEPAPEVRNSDQAVLDGQDVTLTLPGVSITVPGASAPRGTEVRAALAAGAPAPTGVVEASAGVEITMGGRQPSSPLTLTFDVDPSRLASSPTLKQTLGVQSVSGGALEVLSGRYDDATHRYTVQTPHLSWFQLRAIDLGAIVDGARDAVMQGLGLEYPAPDCTDEPATVQGATISAVSPTMAWVCVAAAGNDTTVTIHPNSVIPYVVTSPQADDIQTNPRGVNLLDATMIALARQVRVLDTTHGAASPSTTAVVTYTGAPHDAAITLNQYPALILLAILARVTEVILELTGKGRAITEVLDGLDCLADVGSVAPPGATLDGEMVGALLRAFFGCIGTMAGDTLSALGRVVIGIAASAPAFIVGSLLGILNEVTGQARATVTLDVTGRPSSQGCGAIDPGFSIQRMTGPAVDTARAIYDAAVACDRDALVRLALRDDPELSLGVTTPEEAFAVPNPEDRYWVITRMLSLPPYVHSDNISWPYRDESTGEVDWDGPDASGLVSAEDIQRLEAEGGWSIGILHDGTWHLMFQGD